MQSECIFSWDFAGTPSGKTACRGYPFRLLTAFAATFPKGTASVVAGNFAAAPKGVPLGELSRSD